tara:strand:+ start:97 stop:522 length:426 start_codon:yes stop_codon:yes gene_type:complete
MGNKLLKSELKQIVKECLLEILQDGLGPTPAPSNSRHELNETRSRRRGFDHVSWSKEQESKRPERNIRESIRSDVSQMTSDPILAEVLADSHKTMMNQMEAEKQGVTAMAGDFAERKVASSDPVDLFGAAAGNWAALAFDE